MPGEQGFGDSGGKVVKPGLYRHEAGRGSSGAEGRVVVVKPGFYRHRQAVDLIGNSLTHDYSYWV
ncbi:MAG: hypothetical protein DWI29_04945 [Planctomycetota bacterium]|nr:MAG: hypothetical protein DWI29_04945 [Planctomycetota bacterium]